MPSRQQPVLVFAGRLEVLRNVETFCRRVYYSAFGPEEGERRFSRLTLIEAVDLWRAGLPDSRNIY